MIPIYIVSTDDLASSTSCNILQTQLLLLELLSIKATLERKKKKKSAIKPNTQCFLKQQQMKTPFNDTLEFDNLLGVMCVPVEFQADILHKFIIT